MSARHVKIIAAPSCAGKSYHARRAQQGKAPDLLAAADWSAPRNWRIIDHIDIYAAGLPAAAATVILYTLRTIPHFDNQCSEYSDPRFSAIMPELPPGDITTLVLTGRQLCRNIRRKRLNLGLRILRPRNLLLLRQRLARLRKLEAIYADPANVDRLYADWFDFIARIPDRESRVVLMADTGERQGNSHRTMGTL